MADEVRDELLLIEEVAKVEISGAQEERVFVEYNNARLAEFGLSPLQLRRSSRAHNIIIPGGDVIVGSGAHRARADGQLRVRGGSAPDRHQAARAARSCSTLKTWPDHAGATSTPRNR